MHLAIDDSKENSTRVVPDLAYLVQLQDVKCSHIKILSSNFDCRPFH